MNLIGRLHGRFVHTKRVRRLAERLEALIPTGSTMLDVGCGDGRLARTLLQLRPDLQVRGLDILLRPEVSFPVELYDGETFPVADHSVDVVLFVDVLHHTDDPRALLREAARVARKAVVLKDHLNEGVLSGPTLRFMDWVGNAPSGVRLPYNYLNTAQWRDAFQQAGLKLCQWRTDVDLYSWPASLLFDRSLHILAQLAPARLHDRRELLSA